ncbi:MAG: hypothetical protein U1F42_08840 [Candidatus Competibacteraceae bacterium]
MKVDGRAWCRNDDRTLEKRFMKNPTPRRNGWYWFIFGLLAIMLLAWCATYPNVADVEAILGKVADGNAVEMGKAKLQALQSLRSEHANAFRDLFQLAIASVLVPILRWVVSCTLWEPGDRRKLATGNEPVCPFCMSASPRPCWKNFASGGRGCRTESLSSLANGGLWL